MYTFLVALHIMVCIVLILVVLLQRGKGGDVGAALGGGGSNTVFGSRGAGNFLTKLTTGSATIFMITSLSLAYLGNQASNPLDLSGDVIDIETPAEGDAGDGVPTSDGLEEIDPGALEEIDPGALEEIPVGDDGAQ